MASRDREARFAHNRGPRVPRTAAVAAAVALVQSALLAVPALAATTLVLSPPAGPAGQRVVVTGQEYFANSEVRVYFDASGPVASRRVAITTANGSGAISTSFIAPIALAGDKTVFACSVFAGEDRCQPEIEPGIPDPAASATFTHFGFPSIRVFPFGGEAGSTATVTGENFSSSGCGDVHVVFDFGGDEQIVVTPTLTSGGAGSPASFDAEFTVPDRPVGSYAVVAEQNDTGCQISPRSSFDVLRFDVTPSSGAAGSSATASGEGFPDATECGPVSILFDGELVTQVATTGFPGDPFDQAFTVPDRPPGTYVVEATQDGCGERRGRDTFTIPEPSPSPSPTPSPTPSPSPSPSPSPTPSPSPSPTPTRPPPTLTIDPAEGPVGTAAEATGGGFDADAAVELRFGATPVATVDPEGLSAGAFTVPVVVPDGTPGGPVTVTACQRCDAPDERAATTVFVVTPRLFVEPGLGPPGFVAGARGDGFPATSDVTLSWQPGIGSVRLITDEAGRLQTSVLVFHHDVLGPRELQARVGATPEVVATAPFVVVPGTAQPRNFAFRR